MMRLDKYVSQYADLSRKQARAAIIKGNVTLNGEVIKAIDTKVQSEDSITLEGEPLSGSGSHHYYILNKPKGVLCATEDAHAPTVIDLMHDLPAYVLKQLHPAGRLDKDTTGLVLMTTDGNWSHRITSPNAKLEKHYRVTLAEPADESYITACHEGIQLRNDDKPTRPAVLSLTDDPKVVRLALKEGRYHQVKRMMAALGNKVVELHRFQVGEFQLDDELEEGCYIEVKV